MNYDNLIIIENNIINYADIKEKVDYEIHGASIIDSNSILNYPVDVIKTSVVGTINLLDSFINKNIKSIIFLSSIEVYGLFKNDELIELKEDVLGNIDLMNLRNSYPESKRMVENISYYFYFKNI